ncbi:sensor histidine kinase [Streptomyces sp. SID3343]|nr:sensor histidine kinase [Streptomyces sp. SID3343]MYV96792.1 sensor histidine kinase [Streptomyces sp. SID3343]
MQAVPRNLREDLWTAALAPVPSSGQRSPWRDWLPTFLLLLVPCTATVAVFNVNGLAADYGYNQRTALLLGLIQSVALVTAVFRPVASWWVATIVMVVVEAGAEFPLGRAMWFPWTIPGIIVQTWVLFLLALRLRLRVAVAALVISLVAGRAGTGPTFEGQVDGLVRAVTLFTLAVVVGALLRSRRVARTQLVVQEELTAEERGRRTLLEERNRIARELHDVVAHHMSVISIQAQVAPHLVDNPSEELKENLAGIRQNAVEALTELRRVLGVLRSEDTPSERARHAPQPTLGRLDELLDNVRGAGLTVTSESTGAPHPLPPGVELSAFRIVQEALSNAMRHAPGAHVRVGIGYRPSGVTVRVANTAPARPVPPSPGPGHGLLGMRERAAMLGGELAAGTTSDGGWEVTAILPADFSKQPVEPVEDTR